MPYALECGAAASVAQPGSLTHKRRAIATLVVICTAALISIAAWHTIGAGSQLSDRPAATGFHRQLLNENFNDVPTLNSNDVGPWQIVALVFLCTCLTLAASGGVGGGPMLVPILTVFLNFSLKRATPLSNVIIVGGGISNCAFNFLRAHPKDAARPVIDYDLVLMIVPMVIAGAVLGVFLSNVAPAYATAILLVIVLAYSGYKSMLKGLRMRKKEQAARADAKAKASKAAAVATDVEGPSTTVAAASTVQQPAASVTKGDSPVQLLKDVSTRTPWAKVAYLAVCCAGIVAWSFGGEAFGCDTTGYWICYWLELPWAMAFSIVATRKIVKEHKAKEASGQAFADGDFQFDPKNSVRFLAMCIVTGAVASLCGIGGGVLIAPLLVEMKVLPQVASAVTAALVLVGSAVAVLKFSLQDSIIYSTYTWLLFLMGLVLTFVAQKLIMGHVRKTGAASIIVLCIGTSIILGSFLMVFLAVSLTVAQASDPYEVNFCGAK